MSEGSLPQGYSIRTAEPEDADELARQRGQMFVDMGWHTDQSAAVERPIWAAWIADSIAAGAYAGYVAEFEGRPVGGVGVLYVPRVPSSVAPSRVGAYILNMSVDFDHRRRGLAEALLRAAMDGARARGVQAFNLHAAPMGIRLYERLGFVATENPDMRLLLPD